MRPTPLSVLQLVLLAACSDHIGTTYAEAPRNLTSEALLPRLEAGRPVLAEAFPIGTPAEGRRCGGTLGTTELPGLPAREALRSSIAWATDGLLGNAFEPGQTYERQLRAASIRHDYCYGHGLATYGRRRQDCDLWIRADALRLCRSVEGSETRARCVLRGDLPFAAVAPLGWTFYHDNLQTTCEYDPGINPPRDFVLGGRFLRVPGLLPGQVLHLSPEGTALRLRITGFAAADGSSPVRLLDARLPFDAVAFAANRDGLPPNGRCLAAPCSLAAAGLRPREFLALAPKVADLDGDGLDDVALMAVHGLRDPYASAYGMVAFALSPAATTVSLERLDPARVAAGFVRTEDEVAAARADGTLPAAALRQQIDVLGQSWLVGRFLPERRNQLLLVALRVESDAGERRLVDAEERGFAEFRMLDFPSDQRAGLRLGPPRMRRTLFRDDGVFFTTSRDPTPLTELYRRFQNPPMRWHRQDGRTGVLLLARYWLDSQDAEFFRIPPGVWKPDDQDRGIRVIAYGPPAPAIGAPVAAERLVTYARPQRRTGCLDLATWDPDWLGCRDLLVRPTIQERFVWNWTREVNPVLELPDGSNRFAAVALGVARGRDGAPLTPPREAILFYLTPPLQPDLLRRGPEGGHLYVQRHAVLPTPSPRPDGTDGTVAGSWLVYPALAARLGSHGEGGVALFRTAPTPNGGGAALEIAAAVPNANGSGWAVTRAVCPLPAVLIANGFDAKPGIEGGEMAHLRLAPILRVAAEGPRDAFVVVTRERRAESGALRSDVVAAAAIYPVGDAGWTVDGRPCAPAPFGEALPVMP